MMRPFHLYRIWVLEPVAFFIRDVCLSLWWFFRGLRYLLGLALVAAAVCALYEQYADQDILFLSLRGMPGDGDFYATFIMYHVYLVAALFAGLSLLFRRQEL